MMKRLSKAIVILAAFLCMTGCIWIDKDGRERFLWLSEENLYSTPGAPRLEIKTTTLYGYRNGQKIITGYRTTVR